MGDYDFVGQALEDLDVHQVFYKVKQKPGKPLFFGKKQNKLVFALPGNPASALSCFYIYVHLAMQIRSGHKDFKQTRITAIAKNSFTKRGDRTQFLKAVYNGNMVEILDSQSSAMLNSFAKANALVQMPGDQTKIEKNDLVELVLLPNI